MITRVKNRDLSQLTIPRTKGLFLPPTPFYPFAEVGDSDWSINSEKNKKCEKTNTCTVYMKQSNASSFTSEN